MDLDAFEQDRAAVIVTFKGQAATIEYRPLLVSFNLQRGMALMSEPPHDPSVAIAELAKVISGWDLSRHGDVLPITAETIGSLGLGLGGAICRAILEDFSDPKSPLATLPPAAASATPSPATSSPDPAWATVPSSPSPSSTPNTLASPSGTSSVSQTPEGT